MTTIIYGDDTAKSREYYLEERNKYSEKIILDGNTLNLTDFLQATSNAGLFGDQKAVFIEDLLSKRKSSKEVDALISHISLTSASLFLYESKELTPTQLKQLKNAEIKHFKIPATVFAFLDALSPQNTKNMLSLFHELLQHEDANFALFMLQRQIRILLALNSVIPGLTRDPVLDSRLRGNDKAISEVKRLAPWQKGKIEKQAKLFSSSQLLTLHESLYQLERKQKTGTLTLALDKAIDFLLVSL